ncbi:hypothetical protein JK232_02025 [Nissabacter archeti]|uniref:Uncharacterized protein n=1 Tax=Nissabacter archeti TaxID=1917880 RepID=A0ABS5JCI4_9GAMM|nr:hypothetical protein [Nissabacter archeti]
MQTIMPDLFEKPADPWNERIGDGSMLLHGFALAQEEALLAALRGVIAEAPFRRMQTPAAIRCPWRPPVAATWAG